MKSNRMESRKMHACQMGLGLWAIAFWISSAAFATVCIVPDSGGTAQLPPICPGGYKSPDDVHMIINGLPPGTTIIVDASHAKFGLTSSGPGGSLGGEFEQFSSFFQAQMNGTGSLAGFNRFVNIPLNCETHIAPRFPGNPVQSFVTDMFSMQGEITFDPDFDLLRVKGGTSFGMPSPGHTTLTQLGPNWAVDSFFDIVYEMEFIGAPGGPLAGMSGSTTGTIRMQAGAPTIEPGTDKWHTESPSNLVFGSPELPPIPASFFYPGSDPFLGTVMLQGVGIELGCDTDTVVQRLQSASLPFDGAVDTVPIQLVLLSLTSVNPIVVPPALSQWDVEVSLAPAPSMGNMTMTRLDDNGGTFTSQIQVQAILTFTEVGNPTNTQVMPAPPLFLVNSNPLPWTYVAQPVFPPICGGQGPNFFPDPNVLNGEEKMPPNGANIHTVKTARQGGGGPGPKDDRWSTWRSVDFPDGTSQDFSSLPIPFNFFSPGSEPFTGIVILEGSPIDSVNMGDTSAIVRRPNDPILPADPVGTIGTVPIELVQLSLVSASPITVTYNNGNPPELWEVNVGLSPTLPAPAGTMTAQKTHPNGGLFSSQLFVQPLFRFRRISDSFTVVLDTGAMALPPIQFNPVFGSPWVHFVNPALDLALDPTATFIPGIRELNPGDPTSQMPEILQEQAPSTRHTVCPPQKKRCIFQVTCAQGSCANCPVAVGSVCQQFGCVDTCPGSFSSTCPDALCCIEYQLVGCQVPAGEPPCPLVNPCTCAPPVFGACCFTNGTCVVTTQTACIGALGTYQGDGTVCGGVGGCCYDADADGIRDACQEVDAMCCDELNGVFHGVGTNCGGTGACCFGITGGACENVDALCCQSLGTFHGVGSSCLGDGNGDGQDDLCIPPVGCLCNSAADCRNTLCPDDNACNCAQCVLGTCLFSCTVFGDTVCNGGVTLDDILCVLAGFSTFTACPNGDIFPCGGNGTITLDDILAVLAAFGGANPCGCQPTGAPPLCGSNQP